VDLRPSLDGHEEILSPSGFEPRARPNRNELPQRLQVTTSLQSHSTMYNITMSPVYCLITLTQEILALKLTAQSSCEMGRHVQALMMAVLQASKHVGLKEGHEVEGGCC